MIAKLGLANYFLVVWDIVNFCRRRGILCHGRGSAANSLVAHLLGISAVDPIAQGLVVERFLSVEHGGTPDIDLDIDAARRETVIQYVYDRWGRDHAAMACTYVTYRSASALRDAGYALGFKPEAIEAVERELEARRRQPIPGPDGRAEPPDVSLAAVAEQVAWEGTKADDRRPTTDDALKTAAAARLLALAARLQKRPRHLGLHNGGMIIAGRPIAELVPIEPAAMDDRTVVQFDKDFLERLGIVKIDLLGLRMLSAIADAVELVRQGRGETVELAGLDFRDPAVYDQICSAQTIGLFQVESGAQVSVIPHMQPRCFQDLVIEISLIRPGPLQGNMVRPYLRRRQGLEPVTYLHPALKPALAETLGVIVFQEQVIKLARDFAGFTPGRGEVLRRALGHKHAPDELAKFKQEFLAGALGGGGGRSSPMIAEQVWQMIANFAGYSFSKAHAAAFAVIVYWSAWLRVHYPTEYFCGLLRNAPLGTYPANVLEAEARRVGVKFLPFDVNRSLAKATVERSTIRFGLDYVRGLGEARAEAVVQARGARPFASLADFVARACVPEVGVDRRAVENLVLAGACDGFGERRQLLWDLAEAFDLARRPAPQLPLDLPDERAALAPMPNDLKLMRTFAVTGVTAGPHLVDLRRDAFARAGCLPYRELQRQRAGARVRAGGLVADGLRRPPTAKGTSFIRLEDADGLVDVIVPPQVYAECREALRGVFVVVEGVLQRNGLVLSILARRVEALPEGGGR
jgi:error-prone DNA polymerase